MSNETQQTAVEQFIQQLEEQGQSWENASIKTIEISIKVEDYLKLKQQAKEMEKERMIEFGELVWKNLLRSDKIMKPRDVYNETYGGNK
jgi:hypothetical protein